MRKYPYSKQAMKLMLATALVATPFATSTSVLDTPVAQADEQEEESQVSIERLVNRLASVNQNLEDGTGSEDDEIGEINDIREKVKNLSTSDWESIIPSSVFTNVTTEYTKFNNSDVAEMAKDFTLLFVTTETNSGTIKDSINEFRNNYSEAFDAIFGADFTVDNILEIFAAVEQKLEVKIFTAMLFGQKTELESLIQEAIDDTLSEDQFSEYDGILYDNLGIGVQDLFDIQSNLQEEVDSEKNHEKNILKGLVRAREAKIIGSSTVEVNKEQDYLFEVKALNDTVEQLASIVEWKSSNNSVAEFEGNTLKAKKEGDINVQAYALNVELLSTPVEIVDGGSTTSPGSGPSDDDDTSTEPDEDETREDENTVTPGEDAYEDERVTDDDGVERVVRRVDPEDLAAGLEDKETVERVRIEVEKEEGERAEVRLSKDVLDVIKEKNEQAQVEVAAEEGKVRLSVEELDEEKLRSELGLTDEEEDVEVSISVNTSSDDNGVLESNNLAAKSPVVEFNATVSSGDREVPLKNFKRHVERDIVGEEEFDETNSVVLRLDDEGNGFSTAPTIITGNNATFKTQSFSKYVVVENEKEFVDVPSDYWAKDYFDKLGARYIFQGREDNTVAPGEDMRRAQFAALIVRSLGLSTEEEYDGEFSDVDADDWFTEEIQPAIEQGIIKGRKDGTFAPNESVTRQQTAAMLSRAMEITGLNEEELDTEKSISSFEDVERIGDWAKEDVERLVQAGVIDGREDGTIFDPKVGTTRAQMAKMLDEYLKFINFSN